MPDLAAVRVGPALSATSDYPVVTPPALEPEVAPNAEPSAATGTPPAAETPAPEGTEGEAQPVDETPPQPEAKPARRDGVGERLSAMARQRDEARGLADRLSGDLERALDAIKELSTLRQPPSQQEHAPPPAQPDSRPQRDQFSDPDSYDAALIEWSSRAATRTAMAEAEQKAATERAEADRKAQADAAAADWNTVRSKFVERREAIMADSQYADYAEVAENPDLEIPQTMLPVLFNVENGPQVLYHLGKNPAEASRIAKLNPLQQAIEIGRLSADLARPVAPPQRRLPASIAPVGSRNGAGPKSPDEMTMDEYAASRLPKLQAERRPGGFGRVQ